MLDVLRALAIAAVFVQHLGDRFRPFVLARAASVLPSSVVAWFEALLSHGHWGVDLFFVLSGFTLGLGFVRQHDAGFAQRASSFFARRAARILPAFYLALVVHLLAHVDLFRAEAIWRAIAVHAALLQGYLAPGKIVLIGASWSLSTEAHFYVLAPLIARAMLGPRLLPARVSAPGTTWNAGRLAVFVAAACLGVWLVRGALHQLSLAPDAHPGLLELSQRRWVTSRVDQFVLGMAAAVAYVRWGERIADRKGLAAGLCALSVVLLAVAAPVDAAVFSRPGGGFAYPVVSIAMTLLVLGAASMREGRAAGPLAPLRWVGVVSYGVFLYHQLGLELAGRWIPGASGESWLSLALTALGGGTLGLLAGWVSWTVVESPALAWVSARLRRQLISA